jgi:hypothetical protein
LCASLGVIRRERESISELSNGLTECVRKYIFVESRSDGSVSNPRSEDCKKFYEHLHLGGFQSGTFSPSINFLHLRPHAILTKTTTRQSRDNYHLISSSNNIALTTPPLAF